MILDLTTSSIEVVLGGAVATNESNLTVTYVDISSTTNVAGSQQSVTNGATPVTILSVAPSGKQRQVKEMSILNIDTAPIVVTIQRNDNSTTTGLVTVTLTVGSTLAYTDTQGWKVTDNTGAIVSSITIISVGQITIGDTVVGSTVNELLYVDNVNTLQQLSVVTYPSLTELSYVKNVTSSIQTQLNGKDALGAATTAENNAKSYADGLVIGLWDDRGSFDASVNAYPSGGGSGIAGAILKGDIWTVSVAGTLPTGQVVEIGDVVRALIDTPGNTQANWAIQQNNIGYVPENVVNKGASGGYVGLSGFSIAFKNLANTFTSLLQNAATGIRTYIFPDKDITVAGLEDITQIATAGGTVDAITATFTVPLTLIDKMRCYVVASGANATTTPTFAPDGLTAHTIVKKGGVALQVGDIPAALAVYILEYNSANTRWELLNPAKTNLTADVAGVLPVANGGTSYSALPAMSVNSTAAPTGTTSATQKMMGLALAITPTTSGKLQITIVGGQKCSVNTSSNTTQIRYGTGAAPANGDAATGSTLGSAQVLINHNTTGRFGFCLNFIVTGLSIGTAYWIDVGLATSAGGTVTITNVDAMAIEL